MTYKVSPKALAALRRLYVNWPDLSEKETEVVASLLYHLSRRGNFRLEHSEGDLVIIPDRGARP